MTAPTRAIHVWADLAMMRASSTPRMLQVPGDTVVVHSMDRLARNLDDQRRLVRTLTAKGVRVEFIKESLTFTGEDSPWPTSC